MQTNAGQHNFPCCGHAYSGLGICRVSANSFSCVLCHQYWLCWVTSIPPCPPYLWLVWGKYHCFNVFSLCGSRKYPCHPYGKDLPYDPPSPIGPQNLPSLSSRISKIFTHPLEILPSLIEASKEVVLFTRMPNFVSFMYFLLNCITDKGIPYMQTPYVLKSQTNSVSFMHFLLNSTTDNRILCPQFTKK